MRPAKLNQDHKGKGHEKEGVATQLLTFGLLDIPLDDQEIAVVTGEPHAYAALYNTRKDMVAEPFLKCFAALRFKDKIKGAYVKVRVMGGQEFEFTDCTLTPPEFELTEGGTTLMSFKVECAPALDKNYPVFISHLGQSCDVEIRSDLPTDQKDLPLNSHGEGEQPEAGKGKGKGRGRGRRSESRVN